MNTAYGHIRRTVSEAKTSAVQSIGPFKHKLYVYEGLIWIRVLYNTANPLEWKTNEYTQYRVFILLLWLLDFFFIEKVKSHHNNYNNNNNIS